MAITNYENAGFNVCIIPIQYFTQNYYYSFDDPGITFGDNLLDFRIEGVENEVFNYSGIRLTVQYSSGTSGIHIYLYNENTVVFSVNDGNPYLTYGLALGIDENQHLGYISIVRTISGTRYGIFTAYEYGSLEYYNWIKGIPLPITYQWQSVPSISGKNGILSLAQIKEDYINEGESVSGASADHFTNLSTENRVDVLINDALPAPEIGGTTVTVEYTIPSLSIGSYEYCKLVAKKNSIPEGPEDGDKIINIDPSLASIVVRGLDELSTYYFVIFIEDDQGNTASSEPQICETGAEIYYNVYDLLKNKNLQDINQYSLVNSAGAAEGIFERLPNFVGTDTILGCCNQGLPQGAYTPINYSNGVFELMIDNLGYGYACIPMMPMYITKISYECKIEGNINQDFKIAVVTDDAYDTHGPDSGENSLRFPNPIQVTDWTYKEYVFTANDRSKIWTYFLVNRNGVELKIRNVKIYGTPAITE